MTERFGRTVKSFRAQVGMTLQAVHSQAGEATVNLELAPAEGRQVFWQQKILLQVGRSELPEVMAVIMGLQSTCEWHFHGVIGDQRSHIWHRHGSHVRMTLRETGRQLFIDLTPGEQVLVLGLMAEQLALGTGLTASDAMESVRSVM